MSKQYSYKDQLVRFIAASALAGMCGSVWASAFQIQEQNVTNLGTAYAGTASLAEDASTGFYNSAGLARLCEEQIAVSGVYIIPSSRFKPIRATSTSGTPVSVPPVSEARAYGDAFVPGIHYFRRIDDCWTFGLNIVSPFGLKTIFDHDSSVRYMSTRANLRTYDIAPSLAYCFGNGFSVGAGIDFVYTQTRLDAQLGTGNFNTDGYLYNTMTKWAYGGHVGVLWQISDCTRIGANYRSKLKIKDAKGTSNELRPAGLGGTGLAFSQSVKTSFTLPDTAVISAYHQFNDCWAIMADAQWTHWKKVQNVILQFGNGGALGTNLNFKDTWRFALGTSYKFAECWLARLGVAYDESPVRDATRTIQVPDTNRTWLAFGGRYNMNYICRGLAIDFGYAHLFFKKNARITQNAPRAALPVSQPQQLLNGNVKTHADILGIQLTLDLV